MWKKNIAVALGMAFLAGSLSFGSTASAYIINVGMEDLAAQEKAAESGKKEEKITEKGKNLKEKPMVETNTEPKKSTPDQKIQQEKKPESKRKEPKENLLQDKKSDTSMKMPEKKALEEPKSVMGGKWTKESTQKTALPKASVQEKKTDAPKSDKNQFIKGKKEDKKERFQEIFRDHSFIYYMDTKSARYIPMPNRQEKMLDVWIKLIPYGVSAEDQDEKTGKYYLEHYYINPKTQQIQFLCELEVTGRPSNAIKERPYSSQNWENLIPGSVEDDIYHSVVKKVKSSSSVGGSMSPSIKDMLDDYLNIAI